MPAQHPARRGGLALAAAILAAAVAAAPPTGASHLADIGPAPAVELIDANGQPFRLDDLHGRAVLVGFVFTTCTGTCPATTLQLRRVDDALRTAGLGRDRVAFVAITLDPEQDTPEVLARYATLFGCAPGRWHFLTGPPERVRATWAAWDMWARRNASGALDHPSRIFLIDPRGHRREIYNLSGLAPEVVVADVRALLAEAEARP